MIRQYDIGAGVTAEPLDGPIFGALIIGYSDGATWQWDDGRVDPIPSLHSRLSGRIPHRRLQLFGGTAGLSVHVAFAADDKLGNAAAQGQARRVVALSAVAGDALSSSAPTNGSSEGYALTPGMTAFGVRFLDTTHDRTVTKWVQSSSSGVWTPAAQLQSTANVEAAFDQMVIVGSGRLYFQIADAVGALSVEAFAQVGS